MIWVALALYLLGVGNMWLNLTQEGTYAATRRQWVGCFFWPVLIAMWLGTVAVVLTVDYLRGEMK